MTVESATYLSQLDPNNPGGADLVQEGDDHIRLLKAVLKATFPNLTGPVTATQTQLNNGVPVGSAMVWLLPINQIPAGWALCNGQTVPRSDGTGTITTPNLLNKFILGTTDTDPDIIGTTGGAKSVSVSTNTAGAHSHSGSTSTAGQHSHGGSTVLISGGSQSPGAGSSQQSIQPDGAHNHTVTTSSAGDHSHTVSVSTMPPYVKYPWIMKI